MALAAEGVPEERIHLTGNTVVDALLEIAAGQGPAEEEDLVLITAHRRESFGEPLARKDAARATVARRDARLKDRERSWRRTAGLTK